MNKFGVEHVKDRYEPWEQKGPFYRFYKKLLNPVRTVVDIIRCWELWDLVSQTTHLEGAFLEVGCWKGGSGALIAKAAQMAGIQDPVYLCDTFIGTVKGNEVDEEYEIDGQFSNASPEQVRKFLKKNKLFKAIVLAGLFPEETASWIDEDKIRFCHIDVDTYLSAKDSYEWVWPRLVVGGILVYDDYGYLVTPGISRHVNEIRFGEDRRSLYNLNEHAVIIKLA